MRDEPVHPSLATSKGRWSENYAFDAQVAEVEVDTETGQGPADPRRDGPRLRFSDQPAAGGRTDRRAGLHGPGPCLPGRGHDGRGADPQSQLARLPHALHPEMAASEHLDVITEEYEVGEPYRTKEVGEGYVSAILAAIANAIYNAVGVRLFSTPFTPEKILRGLGKIKLDLYAQVCFGRSIEKMKQVNSIWNKEWRPCRREKLEDLAAGAVQRAHAVRL